jgi:hypothetical protein
VVDAQTVVLSDDPRPARALGRSGLGPYLGPYLGLSNVVANLRRLGFTDEDLTLPGSDRRVDTLAAHGSADAIATRLRAHLNAGAEPRAGAGVHP